MKNFETIKSDILSFGKDCYICGCQIIRSKNRISTSETYFCKNASKYNYIVGGNSHYEIINSDDFIGLNISLDNIKTKIIFSKILDPSCSNAYDGLFLIKNDSSHCIDIPFFDLVEFMKINTKVELREKIENILIFL